MRFPTLLLMPALLFGSVAIAASTTPSTELDKLSYSLGVKTGENFIAQEIKIDTKQFSTGLNDAIAKNKLAMSEKDMQTTIVQFQNQQIAKIKASEEKIAAANLIKSNQFFEENKKKPNVTTLTSGLQYTEITAGKGKSPKNGDVVTVNYRGTLLDGTEFDSSYSRNEPSTLELENLIPGWQEALVLMKPGAKWKIFVPATLAYGEKGAGRVIEPNSALIFEIELLKIEPKSSK